MPIKLLDNSLINKIAAGEVVERPSSVVKELVENSIDAGSTEIVVEIENGGKSLIKIIDNGCGINHDELVLAFSRHATSKIATLTDLENIASLGFRGEALSSISSVSNVEVITKTKKDELAKAVVLEQGVVTSEKFVQRLQGTTFIVRDLFFNVPVRQKFLKKNSIESSAISEIVTNLIISNPNVSFKFINNGVTLLQSDGDGNLNKIMQQIAGRDLMNNLLEVDYKYNDIKISGVISNFDIYKSTRKNEYLFINTRFIKNKMISDVIESFFSDKFEGKKYPVFALNLEMSPDIVDVNVHPTKLEVRFADESLILDVVESAIKKALESVEQSKIPSVDFKIDKNNDIRLKESGNKKKVEKRNANAINLEQFKFADFNFDIDESIVEFEKSDIVQSEPVKSESVINDDIKYTSKSANNLVLNDASTMMAEEEVSVGESIASFLYTKDKSIESKISDIEIKPKQREVKKETSKKPVRNRDEEVKISHDYKIIGQIFATYWLLEKDEEIFFFDQHAGHEIYLYYKFMNDFKNSNISSQILLEPKVISLEFKQSEYLYNNIELFRQFGYDVEVFDDNIYTLKSVPIIFDEPSSVSFFIDIINELSEIDETVDSLYELQAEKIMSMSCRSAVKANDILTKNEAKAILDEVLSNDELLKCPHGRPTLIKVSKKDIEKMFKRI